MRSYYTFPLDTEQLMQKHKRHQLCELKIAIKQYIHLILITHLTEFRYDYDFGCYIWNQDFENIQSINKWEHELETQIKTSIVQYEKRLSSILIKIKIQEPKDFLEEKKRSIHITINGTIEKTNVPFEHEELIYFSPLSIN